MGRSAPGRVRGLTASFSPAFPTASPELEAGDTKMTKLHSLSPRNPLGVGSRERVGLEGSPEGKLREEG